MTTSWHTVSVFISSTFHDMHAERDYLVKKVFPDLQEWCERRRLRLLDVDLRWGVTETDATLNRNVVQVCLDRINECRPFFLCFLGQRYGWIPRQEDVSPQTLQSFPGLHESIDQGRSVTDLEVLHAVTQPFAKQVYDQLHTYRPAEHSFFYLREPSYLDDVPHTPYRRSVTPVAVVLQVAPSKCSIVPS